MPPLKSSLIKPSKSMLFFHIWNANFSVTPINSQMYMTKPKQVKKKTLRKYWENFTVIMPPFTSRGGGGKITEMTVTFILNLQLHLASAIYDFKNCKI